MPESPKLDFMQFSPVPDTPAFQGRGIYVKDGIVYTPVSAVIVDLFDDYRYKNAFAWKTPQFTRIILESISEEGVPMFASGTLTRVYRRGPIPAHNEISRRMHSPHLDPEWVRDLDAVQRQAILNLYSGQLDCDLRLDFGSLDPQKVLSRIAKGIRAKWKSVPRESRTLYDRPIGLETAEFPIDTGLACLLATFSEPYRIRQTYKVALTPVPTGGLLNADWRIGPRYSGRNELIEITIGENGSFYLSEPREQLVYKQTRVNEPEHIEEPRYESLARAVHAGLRTIRDNINAERDLNRAVDGSIPIEQCIDWETIRRYRYELRRHVALFREGGQVLPGDNRIEEIIREGILVFDKNPIRASILMCAIGIMDVFAPGLHTLSETYDIRANPAAHDFINRLRWPEAPAYHYPQDAIMLPLPLQYRGFTQLMVWLEEKGFVPWWQDITPIPGAIAAFGLPKNPYAAAKLFDMRQAVLRH